jgi:hypothetical protein
MGKTVDMQDKMGAGKANGYPNGTGNGASNGVTVTNLGNTKMTPTEIYKAISVGQTVWLAQNICTCGKNGLETAAYWGAEGTVTQKDDEDEMVSVRWKHSQGAAIKVFPQTLLLEPLPFKCGEWVRVSHCDDNSLSGWFSNRSLKPGHPVLVLDMRRDGNGAYECLVRALPFCSRPAWELVLPSNHLSAKTFPEMKPAPAEELIGGYKAADVVYAIVDVPTMGTDKPGIQIGRGDAGVIFSFGHDDNHLTVCFECRQDTGNAAWVSMEPGQISHNPPLVKGRRVRLQTPIAFPDGTAACPGDLGTLLECRLDGDSQDLVLLDNLPNGIQPFAFDAPPGSIVAIVEKEPVREQKEARLRLLESIVAHNDKNGRSQQNMSVLCQNLLPVLGFGTGIGVGYCGSDRGDAQSSLWTYLPLISETLKCGNLKEKRNEGLDGTLSKEETCTFSHSSLINDRSRVDPYLEAITRAAAGKHVLDIGTGMMCLLARLCLRAGAKTVDAVEVSRRSVVAATAGFDNEAAKQCPATDDSGNLIPGWASLNVAKVDHEQKEGANPRLKVDLEGKDPRSLSLYEGFSSDTSLGLTGGYTLLVHEILGDMAGTECAARVVHDIRQRGLCAPDCVFIPQSASTMVAPTAKWTPSMGEKALFRLGHEGSGELKPLTRYTSRHFPLSCLLANPQPMEVLDFGGDLQLEQTHDLEFRTIRDDDFDGVHVHLFAQVGLPGSAAVIDTLQLHNGIAPDGKGADIGKTCATERSRANVTSSWNTMYVRLYETPIHLPKGSRIRLECKADLVGEVASYSIKASVGEKGEEKHHVEYDFAGC